jgi:ATP-dependent RNA helicase DDX5/DBP2
MAWRTGSGYPQQYQQPQPGNGYQQQYQQPQPGYGQQGNLASGDWRAELSQGTPNAYRSYGSNYPEYGQGNGYGDWRGEGRELGATLQAVDWNQHALPEKTQVSGSYYEEAQGRSDEEVEYWRQEKQIGIRGREIPKPLFTFEEAGFPRYMLDSFKRNGWVAPTDIQAQSWPVAMQGRDLVGIAKTGSGKTLSFGIPGLLHIAAQPPLQRGDGPIMLVLAPTRELAIQIEGEIRKVCPRNVNSVCCYGGQPKRDQMHALRRGAAMVIATPGRLIDFLESQVTNLRRVSYLVMDEADRMLDMGFEPDVRKIVSQIRPDRQTLLWSATWPKAVQGLARDFQNDIIHIQVGSDELTANADITQDIIVVSGYHQKLEKLYEKLTELEQVGITKMLIFCGTKKATEELCQQLYSSRYRAFAIHGDKEQPARERCLSELRRNNKCILVATDVAQRGLDVPNLPAVVNFDMPEQLEDYVHRIGRTGRAGKKGLAISFFTPAKDCGHARGLVNLMRKAGQVVPPALERCV